MPADPRLFDSSSMTPPPAPEIDAMTCTVGPDDSERRRLAFVESATEFERAMLYVAPGGVVDMHQQLFLAELQASNWTRDHR